ncbi:TMV resistance protein N isoform X2 [Vigna radiata var. radiata]|uniref:TMV resistance protein N isoform X2 n=1 Tax=Vigna radiata var. radiata TaxID=3916 RepID=A0A1S3UVL2_VIGRR|nr:TMV resistance protein N isoform X2 [Vigna radiata var. radiata]
MANHGDFTYDVFMSFKGENGTRYSFTDHLYRALLRHGINAFRDDQSLRSGDEIRPSLLQAIEASRISLVVLCQNYASSSWCLDELAKILHCYENKGKHIVAIFYLVEPSDVRYQKNSYATAMSKHESRYGKDSEKVKAWRSALSRVCDLTGIHCRNHMYETEVIEKIVKDTLAKLPPMPLQIKHLVGLDSRLERVKSLIDVESNDEVCILGIYGVGGIGKTTFAVDLYNKIRHHFEAASFLANVREKTNKSIKGLEDLQRTLLSEMGEETETIIGSTFKGSSEIKCRLGHKRVLLVVDDVDSVKQLEALAGGYDWFGPGSRIIITTRDKDVLHKHDVEIKGYKMEELNYHESLELFCWYAFNRSRAAENFANISTSAVRYAKGIPLALRVIGSNLKGRGPEECETELQKYRKVPDLEIQGVLEISYTSLSNLDQKIFLDIACFFKGERWDYVKRILDACDFNPDIKVFVSKCLITVDENGCLEMHDLIQDMGREIVRKESPSNPGYRSRLWCHKDVHEGSDTVEGIMLYPPKIEKIDYWTVTAFKKMKNLRILIVRNAIFSSGPSYLPNSLRLIDWKGYPSKSFPPDFYPHRIVDFKLPHSSLIFRKPFQRFEDLTFINLSHCQLITQIPDLSGAKSLKVFTLDNCYRLTRFDKSIGFMPNLVYLSASECTLLTSFVPTMYLPSLEVLSFNFCRRLEHFPHVMQKMNKPLKIYMMSTAIKKIPESIGNLTGLEHIEMSVCKELKNLPSSFFLLPKLVTLKVDECSQLGESFQRFRESRHSVANGSSNLVTLHFCETNPSYEDLCAILEIFPKLEDFNVSHNGFVALPNIIGGSSHLKSLNVSFCRNLKEIPELPLSIQKVDARYCQSLTSEASSMLWSKVSEEIPRIQVVMPMLKREIPEWFDCIGTKEIPHFWARRKFPVVALAFVFQESRKKLSDLEHAFQSAVESFTGFMNWHTVSLHLFIDGQEICGRDYHCFNVGEDHVLFCDLRVLFRDEEWQGLEASLGDDWKAIQVQYESDLILSHWGVNVYEQETNMDDIQFKFPTPSSTRNLIPSSLLVPKGCPKQKMKHMLESFDPRDMFTKNLSLIESEEGPSRAAKVLLRTWRNAKAEITEEASVSVYGASLKQEHEECVDDVVQVLEMIKENVLKHFSDSNPEEMQSLGRFVERLLRARVEVMKEDALELGMPILLEYTDVGGSKYRRFWGVLQLEVGDPFYKAVLRKYIQLSLEFSTSNKAASSSGSWFENLRISIVLLKCLDTAMEEASGFGYEESLEEGYYDPELQELMMRIEQDGMGFNKSYGKMKASIVRTDESVSPKYLFETLIFRRLIALGKLSMFGSATKFKITPYGNIRVEDDPFRIPKTCFWSLILVLYLLFFIIIRLFCLVGYVGLLICRIPVIGKILVCGWWLVMQILMSCKYLYHGMGKIMKIKKKDL